MLKLETSNLLRWLICLIDRAVDNLLNEIQFVSLKPGWLRTQMITDGLFLFSVIQSA